MSSRELLADLRSRGVELRITAVGRIIFYRGASDEDGELIAREKLWLLMLLTHEAGADEYGPDLPDPRLAFVTGEKSLSTAEITARLRQAFDLGEALARAYVQLALEVGYLREKDTGSLSPHGSTAEQLRKHRTALVRLDTEGKVTNEHHREEALAL